MKSNRKILKRNPVFIRPTIAALILKKLTEVGYGTINAFFPAKYPEARIWRRILGLDKTYKFSKQTFHSVLWRLQKQKLVERDIKGWNITELGRKLVGKVKYTPQAALPKEDGIIRLVIFDIPEYERKKRVWLRLELIAHRFKILQKSVWIGYRPLPQELLESLEDLSLQKFVHIISIEHSGTLENAD
ncbi:hypothetical protein A3B05_02070 [Candidatus Giovannonibacteria bacterium RIFCSPLOWO2_01_FULL_43_160]|uniref:Transcriptional repressor PaaX-like central Cas2-like domain-containing protein n=1 Tax=Candidatus Giovannonibacteria bacterium RIFCSPLOWO2_12_FULL_43_26 TaxID=1798363 RepID=A0A1F5XUT8_9BACT|nr:MAG: Transcriptional regulator, PaaX family [Candidatus Giovannonibacteria bacterium GW2011_GWC2_43_8]OGF58538.1 MAG: hypothetical protein A2652_02020 [Candidatus Giovannonibacteria bacterium RIFCSPHIGHO2_01_FULL_43_140]OGF70010.1 MAG: hypothetical protein A3C76_02390 [Candidatus Giovannonibacteria bacterium RIFCSPHIGHO2_02_FULL_44_51]OGF72022.1 MAG: hypothetical protein A3E35_03490 [Candidatus Giovannonibacteria bacterium RIFCSPHIGHO2_12_FULL_44_22]OGF75410.1 MAG: hypothetical protein A3B05